jgi:hypothetical protein
VLDQFLQRSDRPQRRQTLVICSIIAAP